MFYLAKVDGQLSKNNKVNFLQAPQTLIFLHLGWKGREVAELVRQPHKQIKIWVRAQDLILSVLKSLIQTAYSRQFHTHCPSTNETDHAGISLESKSGFIIHWFEDLGWVLSLSLIFLICKVVIILLSWIGHC